MVVYTVLVMAANNLTIDGFQLLDLKILTNSWQANHSIEDDKKLRIFIAINLLSSACNIPKEMDIELIEADYLIN